MAFRERIVGDQVIQATQYRFPYHYIPDAGTEQYLSRHWKFAPSYIAALNLLAEHIKPVTEANRTGFSHIDIGCGDGAIIHHLAQQHGLDEKQLVGVDIDERAIAWARLFNPGSKFYVGDLSDLEGGYDSASLVEVLEHIPPDELPEFVACSTRLLKPGGTMIVTIPSVEKPVAAKHFQHFNFDDIRDILGAHLEKIEVRGFERHDRLTRVINRVRMNSVARIDAPALNRVVIKRLRQLHTSQAGCGRLFVTAKRKTES